MSSSLKQKLYILLLLTVGAGLLGPLAALSAAYMNFRLGFYLGGSVLAGVLGSLVTIYYGREGRHGANYIQTLASAMGSMGGMSTILQAMHWLELPIPSPLEMSFFYIMTGLFGIGVGMLYTPLLVDRWQLAFPSGKAVADLLSALTDPELLRRSIFKMGSGVAVGLFSSLIGVKSIINKLAAISPLPLPGGALLGNFSAAVVGAGMIVGIRIGLPALVMGGIGYGLTPYLKSIGWLKPDEIFRNIGFVIGLAMILGASLVHVGPILYLRVKLLIFEKQSASVESNILFWTIGWGVALVIFCSVVWQLTTFYVVAALLLALVFVLINGISTGISDSNPISSAFVLTVLLLVIMGLEGVFIGLMASAIVLISCNVGVDMQQDRSTGWRLGSNRQTLFLFQIVGILVGAPLAVYISEFFFQSFPELLTPGGESAWESAMTLKIAGVLEGIGSYQAHQIKALVLGVVLGFLLELSRRLLRRRLSGERELFSQNSTKDFLLDAVFLPTPFAASFGGFVSLSTVFWFAAGSLLGTLLTVTNRRVAAGNGGEAAGGELSRSSLIGGGLITGETLGYVITGFVLMLGLKS